MEKSNPATGGSEHPAASGGDAPDAASPVRKPITSFGQTGGGADKGVTLNVRCRLTIRNGAGLLGGADTGGPRIGGADLGGPHIGGGDDSGRELMLEFEGSASLNGGSTTFGGADTGGPHIGGAAGRPQIPAPRAYETDRGKGGLKAS